MSDFTVYNRTKRMGTWVHCLYYLASIVAVAVCRQYIKRRYNTICRNCLMETSDVAPVLEVINHPVVIVIRDIQGSHLFHKRRVTNRIKRFGEVHGYNQNVGITSQEGGNVVQQGYLSCGG